jgi:hypothetical protein
VRRAQPGQGQPARAGPLGPLAKPGPLTRRARRARCDTFRGPGRIGTRPRVFLASAKAAASSETSRIAGPRVSTVVRTAEPQTAGWHSRPPHRRLSSWAAVVVAWLGSGQRRPSLVVEPNNQRMAAPRTQGCATLPRGASLAAPLRLRIDRSARLARRIEAHGVPLAGLRPTPTRSARTSGRLRSISPQPPDVEERSNGGSGARPPSEPALRKDSTSVGGVRCLAARPGRRARRCARVAARCRRT